MVSPVFLHFCTVSECERRGSFAFSGLNGWEGESLIKSYGCLQTWVTKYWTLWTSDKIYLDNIPLKRRGYQVPPPTKKLFAIVTRGERGKNSSFPLLSDTAYPPFSRAAWPGVVEEHRHTPRFNFWDYDSIIFPFPSFLPSLPKDSFLLAFRFMELYAFVCVWIFFVLIFLFYVVFIVCLPAFVLCCLSCLFRDHEAGGEDLRGTAGGERV